VQLPRTPTRGRPLRSTRFAVMAVLATHDGLSNDIAYAVTKALYENTDILGQVHPKGKEISLKTALQSVSIPLHPAPSASTRKRAC